MVKTPTTRHSSRPRDPVTIDLEPEAIRRDKAESAEAAIDPAEPAMPVSDAAEPPAAASDPTDAPAQRDPAAFDADKTEPSNLQQAIAEAAEGESFAHDGSGPDAGAASTDSGVSAESVAKDAAKSEHPAAGFGRAPRSEESSTATPPPARAAEKATPRRGGGAAIAAGIVGAVVALAGAGALQYAGVLPSPSAGVSSDRGTEIAALRSEIEALKSATPAPPSADPAVQAAVDELRGKVASLEQAVAAAGSGDGETAQALEDRFKALESSVAALGQSSAGDPAAIAALGEKVTGLETQTQAAGQAVAGAEQKLAAVEQTLAGLTAKVDAQAAQPKIAMAIATAALKSALERGVPFTAELETFAAIAPNAPELEPLRKLAETGVPTRPDIEAETDAAVTAMIAAGKPADPNAGYLDRLLSSAESLVKVRPIGAVEGTGVPEIVARLEVAVKANDYAAALAEYDALPEAPKAAGADFAGKLRARLDADRLVDQAIAGAMQAG